MAAFDPVSVLEKLTTEEKIALLSGDDSWHTVPIPRLDIPRARLSDGPNGVRGTAWIGGAPASCFPAATALGASFDVDLLTRIGVALGDECRARGVHCLLGPTTNIQRNPLGGRGFESYAEDPFLAGSLATGWVRGLQSRKVMATPKHYLANEQELARRSNNSVIDERTMHEIYLEPFRLQCQAEPRAMMTSYNRVNGLHASEHPYLLRKILRGDFGFKGLLMSDWSGTYSSAEAIKASLDLEMPGPCIMRGDITQRDMVGGKITIEDIEDCTLRVLEFVKHAHDSGIGFERPEESIDTPAIRALLRESADAGVVLLKNEAGALPIKPSSSTKIAVIGPNAKDAFYSGGGSASLAATYTISPLKAIQEAAKASGATVSFEQGSDTSCWTPLVSKFLRLPGKKVTDEPGLYYHFYDQNPWEGKKVEPLFTKTGTSSFAFFIDGIPKSVPLRGYVSLHATFIPDQSGPWELGLGVAGQADLYINGKKIVDNSTKQKPSNLFFAMGAEEVTGVVEVEAGKEYDLEVRFSNFKPISPTSPYAGRRGGIRVGGLRKFSPKDLVDSAAKLASQSDLTILVIGTNSEWECEAYDRSDMKLPRNTNELVDAVLAADPKTIIVNQSGMPVEMPWIEKAPTLVQAFFGGNECGTAIADVLFGTHNPSGKLPVTFPRVYEDVPSSRNFGEVKTTVYEEGLRVGYRYFDRPGGIKSLFPFGFGLSYTTFAYSDLSIKQLQEYTVQVEFTITNTGQLTGGEAAQVYIKPLNSRVSRPEIELKGYAKVFLQPGESKKATVVLDHSAFSFYDLHRQSWVGEAGEFEIHVGPSSVSTALVAPYNLKESYAWVGLGEPKPIKLFIGAPVS